MGLPTRAQVKQLVPQETRTSDTSQLSGLRLSVMQAHR
jgi:hypothetical protein